MENNEMTEREMLEFAAIAYTGGHFFGFDKDGSALIDPVAYWPFNPLRDDGDALRLLAQLNINLAVYECKVEADIFDDSYDEDELIVSIDESVIDSKPASIRLAITKAAAEIGKRMS